MRWFAAGFFSCFVSVSLAQQVSAPQAAGAAAEGSGSVVGHVYLADTGGPARLAEVALQPVEVKSAERPATDKGQNINFHMYRVGLDGGYRIAHVKAGLYYVVVKQPGYLSPFAMFTHKQLSQPTPDDQQKIDAYLPMVTVVPNNTATLDLRLTRGASLGGTVRFDDGQPYPDAHVSVMQKDSKGDWKPLALVSGGYTDDLGHFRITGLLEGDYLLQVSVMIDDLFVDNVLEQAQSMYIKTNYALDFYSGDTARRRAAKPIHLDSSQEVSSADITIPVSKLHSVTGAIVDAKTGQAINSGTVMLSYADADGEDVVSAKVDSEESIFRMPFVPEGSYTIKAMNVAEVSREQPPPAPGVIQVAQEKETVLRRYGNAEQPLVISGDVSGINLVVTPVAKASSGN